MTDFCEMAAEQRELDARAAGRLTRRMLAAARALPLRRAPWLQWAVESTDAPGVDQFGITATLDRRGHWLALLAHFGPRDRDSLLRAGLRRKAVWLLRFTWRANGVSTRIGVALAQVTADAQSFLHSKRVLRRVA